MYRGIGDTLSSIGIGIAFPFCIFYRYQKYNFSKCTASKRYYFEIPCYNQRANTSSHCKKELSGIFHTLNIVALAQGKLNKTHIYFLIWAARAITRTRKNAVWFVHHGLQLWDLFFISDAVCILIWICRVQWTVPNWTALRCTTWSDELCGDMHKCFSCTNRFFFMKLNVANSCVPPVWVTRVMVCRYWIMIIPSGPVRE